MWYFYVSIFCGLVVMFNPFRDKAAGGLIVLAAIAIQIFVLFKVMQ